MNFSIIIPVKELNDYLKESIPIMLNLDYKEFEIIILPNDRPEKVPEFVDNKKIRIIPSGRVSPAIKRDIGAKAAKGKYLAFIDDDAYPRKDWLSVAESTFKKKKAAALAGPAITPKNNTMSQKASGLFFETLIGGGRMDYRYKPARKSFYVMDFPTVNLIVEKDAFFEAGGFDNKFWPGEDTKFCLDLIKRGHKIWYSNRLIVWHHRRKLMRPHLKQIGNYGKHRGYFAKRFPQTSLNMTYIAPSIFLLGNIGLLSLSFADVLFLKIWGVLITIYFLIAFIDVFMRTSNIIIGLMTIVTVFLSHLTYGAMFIRGLLTKNLKSELR